MESRGQDIDRIAPTRRPPGKPIGFQSWRDLLFLHWRLPPETVAPLLPAGLTLDTYDGSAWVGLVPFRMCGVRPWWSPSIPGVSNFLETNVRTYVHREGRDPGVWFFSLDASSSLAVRVARWKWQLNYFRAEMSFAAQDLQRTYRSRRLWPESAPAESEIVAELEHPPQAPHLTTAAPGTLDHFLVERYFLYACNPAAKTQQQSPLLRGQVHHAPYEYVPARLTQCRQSLLDAAGLPVDQRPAHLAFSPGVDVEIFPLVPADD